MVSFIWKRPINLKPLSLFVFFFALACKRIFIKAHSIESRLENILFAGISVHLSDWKFYRLEQWRGYPSHKPVYTTTMQLQLKSVKVMKERLSPLFCEHPRIKDWFWGPVFLFFFLNIFLCSLFSFARNLGHLTWMRLQLLQEQS